MSTETLEFTPAADELLLHTYAEGAYLDYAMSVVKDRALGQVQDGNKPVHRRILYAMRQLGLTHDAKAVKCARIVGDVLGKYHPHGDTAAYDALVRLAQPFSLRYPLITGQGNFGSPDGDGAAAMRYTEAKLAPISSLLLDEMGAGTVDYKPNYDGSQQEPVLLPARLPFMLLNGTMGIAVGMASNIPPHNLRDVVAAAVAVLANPGIGAAELLTHLPGPDFPGGGQLISSPQDIAAAYEAGRGSLRLRARWVREELARGQWQIVVKELPYQVSTKQVLEEIETLSNPQVANGKKALTQQQLNLKQLALDFLETARDESGKDDAVRLVLVPRNSKVDETAMMAFLLANTGLEDTFGVNATMIGLDGNPATKGVLTVLREWCVFRTDTVRRRCAWELDQAEKRIHVLEGRMTVYLNLDAVIKVIREADEPKDELMARFALSEVQATDILDMRLRALNKLEGIRIEKELSELRAESARLRALLDSEPALRDLVTREIQADGAKYGDERRTLIKPESRAAGATAIARAVTDEPVTVIVSKNLWVRARVGHGLDPATLSYRTGDEKWHVIETRTSRSLAVMDNTGRSYSVRVSDIPSARGDGAPLTAFIDLQPGARVLHALSLAESDELLFASEAGYGLKAPFKSLLASKRAGKEFLDMEPGILPHAPVSVKEGSAPRALCISGDGRMLAFPADEIKTLAAGGKGVKLMELGEAKLTHFGVFEGDTVTLEMELKGKEAAVTVKGAELEKYVLHRSRKGCALPKKGVVTGFSGA